MPIRSEQRPNKDTRNAQHMDRLIRTLSRQSHRIGILPSVLLAIAWVAGGAALARYGLPKLAQSSVLFWFCLMVGSLIVAFGALISFWILVSHVQFKKRGYQVNWLTGDQWVYEERGSDGSIEYLPISRKITESGYPAPCEVHIRSEESWDQHAPAWAQGRRTQIMDRIAEQFGGRVQFCDVDLPPSVNAKPAIGAPVSRQHKSR